MIDWLKGNPDSKVLEMVKRALKELARQKRQDGEIK
jgi:hypothetical protein